jgi:hypothetical protein
MRGRHEHARGRWWRRLNMAAAWAGGEYGVRRVEQGCEGAAAGWTSGGAGSAMATAESSGAAAA